MSTSKVVNILIVEDDLIDAKAFIRAMQKLKIGNPVFDSWTSLTKSFLVPR